MNLSANKTKEEIFNKIETNLTQQQFTIIEKVSDKPWGGFFLLSEDQIKQFIATYFSELSENDYSIYNKLSPKILLVAPHKKLSWQYHLRRAEVWKLINGTAGIITSDTDEEKEIRILKMDEIVRIKCKERHRLVGMEDWGIVAEIWQHTDKNSPSDEEDIIRVKDDFGR